MEITKKNKNFYVWLTPPDRLIDPGGWWYIRMGVTKASQSRNYLIFSLLLHFATFVQKCYFISLSNHIFSLPL